MAFSQSFSLFVSVFFFFLIFLSFVLVVITIVVFGRGFKFNIRASRCFAKRHVRENKAADHRRRSLVSGMRFSRTRTNPSPLKNVRKPTAFRHAVRRTLRSSSKSVFVIGGVDYRVRNARRPGIPRRSRYFCRNYGSLKIGRLVDCRLKRVSNCRKINASLRCCLRRSRSLCYLWAFC